MGICQIGSLSLIYARFSFCSGWDKRPDILNFLNIFYWGSFLFSLLLHIFISIIFDIILVLLHRVYLEAMFAMVTALMVHKLGMMVIVLTIASCF